jgi:hypothetical protein
MEAKPDAPLSKTREPHLAMQNVQDSSKQNTAELLPPSVALKDAQVVSNSGVEPFSVFTAGQKRWISWVSSFGAMFSTLNSYIYFPAVIPIAQDLGVSVALVNLTITSYLVVAGIAPAMMGDLADHEGRRPAYFAMCVLMVGANLGLALQRSYPALFVLRMIQAAGSSGILIISPKK